MRRVTAAVHRLRREDEGSTLPLVVGFAAIAIALVLVVAAASSLYLERKRLFTVADGAALVGAEAFDLEDVAVAADGTVRPRLDEGRVRAAVDDYVGATLPAGFESFAVDAATTDDGRSARVTVSSTWRPPVVAFVLPEGLRVEATATARSVFG